MQTLLWMMSEGLNESEITPSPRPESLDNHAVLGTSSRTATVAVLDDVPEDTEPEGMDSDHIESLEE